MMFFLEWLMGVVPVVILSDFLLLSSLKMLSKICIAYIVNVKACFLIAFKMAAIPCGVFIKCE